VLLSIPSGLLGSSTVFRCIQNFTI